jgi:hypothetical protein
LLKRPGTSAQAVAPARPALDRRGLSRAVRRVATVLLFAALPAVLTLAILSASFVRGPFLYDFRGGLYGAGHDIVRGHNPYRAAYLEHQAALKRAGSEPETVISVPVYPAPALVAAVPFSLLPYRLAGALFSLLSIGALLAALRLLGVSDWRCFGVAFASWPVLHGLMLGALTPLLLLGAAIAWRHRSRLWAPAFALASIIAAKLFPWPLGLWLLATRRFRAVALTGALTALGFLAAWAVIGFAGLAEYPRMLANLSFVSEGVGVSLVAALLALGIATAAAKAAALALAMAILGLAWQAARRPDGDRRAFGLAMIAALAASPMVWPHYLALVFVPIALASPRLSALWFTPLLAYLAPVAQTTGRPWEIVPYLAIAALVGRRLCSSKPLGSELDRNVLQPGLIPRMLKPS